MHVECIWGGNQKFAGSNTTIIEINIAINITH